MNDRSGEDHRRGPNIHCLVCYRHRSIVSPTAGGVRPFWIRRISGTFAIPACLVHTIFAYILRATPKITTTTRIVAKRIRNRTATTRHVAIVSKPSLTYEMNTNRRQATTNFVQPKFPSFLPYIIQDLCESVLEESPRSPNHPPGTVCLNLRAF